LPDVTPSPSKLCLPRLHLFAPAFCPGCMERTMNALEEVEESIGLLDGEPGGTALL
jgi:hypothetical protein